MHFPIPFDVLLDGGRGGGEFLEFSRFVSKRNLHAKRQLHRTRENPTKAHA